jgi:outer membrane protein assembly factor BamB
MNAAVLWNLAVAFAPPCGSVLWHETVASAYALPGGIADPAGRTGFLTDARGGVTAVDLRNGNVLWRTAAAHRPITVTGERLYASVPAGHRSLCVVALDVSQMGQVVFRSNPVAIPELPAGQSWMARWTPLEERLQVTWELTGDAAPRGGVAVDLKSGRVTPVADRQLAVRPRPPVDLAKRVVRWQGVAGGEYKVLILEESAAGQSLVLHGWGLANGQPQPPRVLLHGQRLVVRAAANDRYVWLRDAVPSPDQKADERGRHAWTVIEISTGELVARIPYQPGTQAVALLGPRAYCLVGGAVHVSGNDPFVNPRVLRAIDLKTGKTVWERPVEGKRVKPVGA